MEKSITDREKEILSVLAQGKTDKQIAEYLGISEKTVKFHMGRIYKRLRVYNRIEAVMKYLKGEIVC